VLDLFVCSKLYPKNTSVEKASASIWNRTIKCIPVTWRPLSELKLIIPSKSVIDTVNSFMMQQWINVYFII